MKSLVLCPYLPFPPNHGGRIRSAVLCRALQGLGEVTVAAPIPAADRERAHDLAIYHQFRLESLGPPTQATSTGAKLSHWVRGRSELLQRRWTPAARASAYVAIERGGFDVIAADSSFVLPLLPWRTAVPVVLQLHNLESAVIRRSASHASNVRDRFLRRIEARAVARTESRWLRHARVAVTVSEIDAALARRLAPRANLAVVENSVDLERLPLLPPASGVEPVLLLVGSWSYPPNREAAFALVREHLPELRARWPGLRVRLVGSDPDGALAGLAGSEGVDLIGFAKDLLPHYRAATAVYAPIHEGGGTRIKVLEAFALGRPVISTVVGLEGIAAEAGRHWLSCETPGRGVASLAHVLAGGGAQLVREGRALVESRHAHPLAIARLAEIVRVAISPDGA